MAIARGAGTEIIRTQAGYDVSTNDNPILILGEQHHIYTVLSVIVYAQNVYTPFTSSLYFHGYDGVNGTSATDMVIFLQTVASGDTFVWNDKFSFNGCEGTNFTGPMSTVAEQNLIADQAESSIPQWLWYDTGSASDHHNVFITYIDQNNA